MSEYRINIPAELQGTHAGRNLERIQAGAAGAGVMRTSRIRHHAFRDSRVEAARVAARRGERSLLSSSAMVRVVRHPSPTKSNWSSAPQLSEGLI